MTNVKPLTPMQKEILAVMLDIGGKECKSLRVDDVLDEVERRMANQMAGIPK